MLDVVDGRSDLAADGVRRGEVDKVLRLAFGRQSLVADVPSEIESMPGVAEVDGHGHSLDGDVDRSELGVVVVAAGTDMVGSGLGRFEVPIGGSPVVVPCRDDREDELKCPYSERASTCPLGSAAWHETPISSVSAGQGDQDR